VSTVRSYAEANPVQQALRRFTATGAGSWLFAHLLHRLDRPVYRITRGRHTFSNLLSGLPVIILTTTGARSGQPRSVPVLGLPTSVGLAVIASNFGQQHHPGWYHNLRAHPQAQVGDEHGTRPVHAAEATGELRERIWREGLTAYPGWSTYQRRARTRQIGVFLLTPTG
jgi:deazaflavin-dependent oxidoreductase (nitroreductase family)